MPHWNNENGMQRDSKLELTSVELSFEKKGWFGRRSVMEKVMLLLLFCLVVTVIVLAVVLAVNQAQDDDKQDVCLTRDCTESAARMLNNLDTTVEPCENFFDFACGTWRKQNIIPEDRSSQDVFGILRDEVEVVLKNLLEAPITNDDITVEKTIKNMYKSCMDQDLIKQRNISVAFPLLNDLGGWPVLGSKPGGNWNESDYDLTRLLIGLIKYNNKPLIQMYVYTDVKNSTVRIIYIDQPGFGMPGQKYYQKGRDDVMVQAYEELAKSVALAFGASEDTATNDVKDLIDLEFDIANISMASEERRDSNVLYNRMPLSQLSENFTEPGDVMFSWEDYITGIMLMEGVNITVNASEPVVVRAVPYFEKLFGILQKHGKRTVANYAVWRIMKNRIYNLDETYEELITKYNKVLYGTAVPRARWRTCSSYINSNLGMALGRLFVKEAFDEESKKDTEELIRRLKIAFNELVGSNDWMDDVTRDLAREKANYIKQKIGYQDIILNDKEINKLYSNYTVQAGEYFENVLGIINRISIDSVRLLRTAVDKTWWTTAPATVNAYYNSVLNRIMFPAGILQPPFYGKSQPKSMNYGGIGVVIGHEITHGFDDRGRQYDKDGNLEQWWSDEAITQFKVKAQCIVDQYGNFSLPEADGMNLNGINTQGENIADNGGLKQSYRAYRDWVSERGKEESLLPGVSYNHNQIFFINFAQIWCSNMRRENAINRILAGVHSPGRFRVVGTLQNSPEFAAAFNCPKGSYMNPNKKCGVW
ncbi:neprilysin-like [Ylistrum balloti]|uniref:neprilysin-like n=1 Tax=Ylistrum balloti TaxID=509963 RepID=UPI002905E2C3|nr:neprilysin-like [Ylistrum balloti]